MLRRLFSRSVPKPTSYSGQVFEGETFRCEPRPGYRLPDPLEDVELRRCTFEMCQSPGQRTLRDRPTIRRVKLVRCHVTACELGPVIAEDVTVDTVTLHRGKWGPQLIRGCAFRHVTVKGNVTGGVRFIPSTAWYLAWPNYPGPKDPFAAANFEFYRDVDWALDISEAKFTGVEMEEAGIPARLVRRDPETQVVITRSRALASPWQEMELPDRSWSGLIERFLECGFDDGVLVASKRGPRFEKELETIEVLRKAGVVEPD